MPEQGKFIPHYSYFASIGLNMIYLLKIFHFRISKKMKGVIIPLPTYLFPSNHTPFLMQGRENYVFFLKTK